MVRTAARILLIAFLFVAGNSNASADDSSAPPLCPRAAELPYQIRTSNCDLAAAVASGIARSNTFRQLVARVSALNGIVYVDSGHSVNFSERGALSGGLQHRVTKAGDYRLLHVKVAIESGDRPVLTIAHELRHAIELLESSAITEAEVEALFERIGARAGAWVWETTVALEAEHAVARELSAEKDRAAPTRSSRCSLSQAEPPPPRVGRRARVAGSKSSQARDGISALRRRVRPPARPRWCNRRRCGAVRSLRLQTRSTAASLLTRRPPGFIPRHHDRLPTYIRPEDYARVDEVLDWLIAKHELRRALYRVPPRPGVAGTAATFVLHVSTLMARHSRQHVTLLPRRAEGASSCR